MLCKEVLVSLFKLWGRWCLGGGELVEAFKAGVYGMPDEEQEEEVETKYAVQGSTGKST